MSKLKRPAATAKYLDKLADACSYRWWIKEENEKLDAAVRQWAEDGGQLDLLTELRALDEKTLLINQMLRDRGFKQRLELPMPRIYDALPARLPGEDDPDLYESHD
jgi:hypothetical protein